MLDKILKKIVFSIIKWISIIILGISFYISVYGMDFLNLPKVDNIQAVSIIYPEMEDKIVRVNSTEDIKLILKITRFLKYRIFQKAKGNEQPLITVVYHLKNGKTERISANETTVWWKGKKYVLKDKEIFVNITRGLFFSNSIK